MIFHAFGNGLPLFHQTINMNKTLPFCSLRILVYHVLWPDRSGQ